MEDQMLKDGLIHEIREKYLKIKLRHDIVKKKYEEIREEYSDVKKELEIVREELDKHESGIGDPSCLINGISHLPISDSRKSSKEACHQLSNRDSDEGEDCSYSSDELGCIVVTTNPNHSDDEGCSGILKVNTNGKLMKKSKDFYKRHNEFMQNVFHKKNLYPKLSPVQCYYSGDNKIDSGTKDGFIGCSLSPIPKSLKKNSKISSDSKSPDKDLNNVDFNHLGKNSNSSSKENDLSINQNFNHVTIKKEIDDGEEFMVVSANPNHSGDECGNEISKTKNDGRLKKKSKDFYKRHDEFMKKGVNSENDQQISPYPKLSPVQCYLNSGNKIEDVDDGVSQQDGWKHHKCSSSHPPELECNMCSLNDQSENSTPHHLNNYLYSDMVCSSDSWPRRKRHSASKPYTCEICGNIYAGLYNYNRHKLIHTGEKPHKCHFCDKTFARKDKFNVHLRGHFQENFQENGCNGEQVDESNAQEKDEENCLTVDPDIVKIEPIEDLSLEILSSSYVRGRSRKKKINNITLECDICYKKVQGPLNLIRHKERHAAKKPKVCEVCGKVFKKTYSYNRHRMLHTGEKPFICNLCGEGFSRNDKLLVHTRKHKRYSPERMPYKCDICDLFFSESEHVEKHQVMHSGEEWFTCDICFKSFKLESDLIVHRRSRHIIRPGSKHFAYTQYIDTFKPKAPYANKKLYKCNDCGKTFTERFRMVRHKRTHTNEKSHKCRECGKEFLEKFVLNRHEKTHSKERPHKCDVCDKKFLEKSKLIRHQKIHDNIRPFKCDDCGKAFIEKHRLVYHQRTHAMFKCNVCDECFTDPDSLGIHKQLHNVDDEVLLT